MTGTSTFSPNRGLRFTVFPIVMSADASSPVKSGNWAHTATAGFVVVPAPIATEAETDSNRFAPASDGRGVNVGDALPTAPP